MQCQYVNEYFDYRDMKKKPYRCSQDITYGVTKEGAFCVFHSLHESISIQFIYQKFAELYLKGAHEFVGFKFYKNFDFQNIGGLGRPLKFKNAIFQEAEFLGTADFSNFEFTGDVGTSFYNSAFSGKGGAIFTQSQFTGEGKAVFFGTKFSGARGVSFDGAAFTVKNGVHYTLAEFSGKGKASFHRARFFCGSPVSFDNVEFKNSGGVDFSQCRFIKNLEVIFYNRTFYDNVAANCENMFIESPEKVIFDNVDLNRVRFSGTDLRRINFKEVFWKNRGFETKAHNKRIMVYDEEYYKNNLGKNAYTISRLYNQLRLNYEETGRYHEAGEFFVGEMEMRLKGDFEKCLRKPILFIYKYFSLYGERPLFAFSWIIGLWLFFGLLYYVISFCGIEPVPGKEDFIKTWVDKSHFIQSLRLSLSNLTLGKIEPLYRLTSNTWDAVLKLFEMVFGATAISLFILAMNRKFRRTKD